VSAANISVEAYDPSNPDPRGLTYSFSKVDCSVDGPRATIGDVNCSDLTIPVTLDNSRALTATTFGVFAMGLFAEPSFEKSFELPAGGTQVVHIAWTEDFGVDVGVVWQQTRWEFPMLAGKGLDIDCVADHGLTSASVGDFDCSTRTIPVTIDNSEVLNRKVFEVQVYAESPDFDLDYFYSEAFYDLLPGAVRVVQVRVPASVQSEALRILVVGGKPDQTAFDSGDLAERLVQIKCASTAARPTVAVKSAKLAQTGGFNLVLPLLGVALLTGGSGMLALSGRRRRY
jgi:hypothetical protein